jgi:hypothetical protein
VTAAGDLVVCDGSEEIASAPVPPGTVAMGVVDLDDVAPFEILLHHAGTSSVRVAHVTLRGLAVTDVLAAREIEDPGAAGAPFTATTFECSDVDDDPTAMNIRVSFITADGSEFVQAGLDHYEMPLGDARARFDDEHRCEPGAAPLISFITGPDGWSVLDAGATFEGPGNSLMAAVAADPATGRHVAVGTETPSLLLGEFFEERPAIWWSDDLLVWNRANLGGASGELRDVTALPDGGFVAVGRSAEGPIAWTSNDGIAWTSAELPLGSTDVTGQFPPVASAVTVTPFGLIAVGVETYEPPVAGIGEDLDAAIWTSEDGASWERVNDPSLGTTGFQPNDVPEFNAELIDVAFIPGIGIVAAGSASASDPSIDYPDQLPTVWISTDGEAWESHAVDVDGRLRGVVAHEGEAVVFGVEDLHGSPTSDALVASSPDGRTWTQLEGPFGATAEPDGIQAMNGALFVSGHGLVIVGSDEAESEVRGAAAVWWATTSGWARQPGSSLVFGSVDDSPTYTMTGAAWLDELVVVGFTGRSIELAGGTTTACCIYEPAVWVWRPAA